MKSNDVNTGYAIPSERHATGLSRRNEADLAPSRSWRNIAATFIVRCLSLFGLQLFCDLFHQPGLEFGENAVNDAGERFAFERIARQFN